MRAHLSAPAPSHAHLLLRRTQQKPTNAAIPSIATTKRETSTTGTRNKSRNKSKAKQTKNTQGKDKDKDKYNMERQPRILILLLIILLIANLWKTFVQKKDNKRDDCQPNNDVIISTIGNDDNETWIDIHNRTRTSPSVLTTTTTTTTTSTMTPSYPKERISSYLPKKLYLIYGLESSGTTFFAKTVASALGIPPMLQPDTVESRDRTIHIQHISLPLGYVGPGNWGYNQRFTHPLPIVPVYFPTGCRPGANPIRSGPPIPVRAPSNCVSFMGETVTSTPYRYFVNITSSVRWYRERGVKVYPIMVVRDPSFHFQGILKMHSQNSDAAYVQYQMGREIMLQSLTNGIVNPIIVSYETLMTLKMSYLKEFFEKVDIDYNTNGNTNKFQPTFRNGNLKYAVQSKNFPTTILNEFRTHGNPQLYMPPNRNMIP